MNLNFSTLDFGVIILYFIMMILVGIYYSKKIKDAESYVVADRSLTMKIMIGTTVATCMGAGAVMADVGFVYNVGIGAIVIIGTFHLGWIALIFMSKRLRASGASTLPDFLGMRFSTSTKAIAGIVTLTMMLNTTAAQMAAAGTIMDVLGLTTRDMGIIVGGIFILVLTITGGLYSVAVTDTIQAVLLTIGCGIIVPITAYAAAGGPAEVFSTVRAVNPELLTLKGAITPIGFIGYCFVYTLSAGSHAAYSQRILASVDEKTAFWGSIWSDILAFLISLTILIVGFTTYKLFPGLENGEMTVPLIIAQYFPPVIKGLVMSALIALVVSTADSFLLLLGTTVANDIYKILKPDTSPKQLLFLSRLATVVGAGIAILFALYGGSMFDIIRMGSAAYGAGMFVPLVCACFWKKATTFAVNAGMLVGCFSTLIWNWSLKASTGINGVLIGAALCLLAVVVLSVAKPGKTATNNN